MEKPRKKNLLRVLAALGIILLIVGVFVAMFYDNLKLIFEAVFDGGITQAELKELMRGFGTKGAITVGVLSFLQVILTFLPAEPFQVIGGMCYSFGNGFLICLAGVFLGNIAVFFLYRLCGKRLTDYFQRNLELDLKLAANSGGFVFIVLLLYFLPAIPYGMICFFTASLGVKFHKYIVVTTLGAMPSIAIGVGMGYMALSSNWILSIVVFVVLVALLVLLYFKKELVFKKINEYLKRRSEPYSDKTVVQKHNTLVYHTVNFFLGIYLKLKVKIKIKKSFDRFEEPSLVISNHGSFVDFLYLGRVFKKQKPHFISARLYFYGKKLGSAMKAIGCIPKSMFSPDIENMINCMRVAKNNGILGFMPEARLSTAGEFEDVQPVTYKFMRKMAMPIYVMHFSGDYLASPKWANGLRRGAKVELEVYRLMSKEEAASLTEEAFIKKIDDALYYNEFDWLEKHPEVRYRGKKLAEGLENILCWCPRCKKYETMRTDKRRIYCESCGFQTEMDGRYKFDGRSPYSNLQLWYNAMKDELAKQIAKSAESGKSFSLTSKVELFHASKDGKKQLRKAGEGICTLDCGGLIYSGTEDGETKELRFGNDDFYRLLFGAGVDFELYQGREIWYFVPEEKRGCVLWYVVSGLFKTMPSDASGVK